MLTQLHSESSAGSSAENHDPIKSGPPAKEMGSVAAGRRLITAKCVICQSEFKTRSQKAMFCGHICHRSHINKIGLEKRLSKRLGIVRVCAFRNCKKEFSPRLSTKRIYCSASCKHNELSLRGYYRDKPGRNRTRNKYLESHKEQTRKTTSAYRLLHREERAKKQKEYYRANKGIYINQKGVRRSREKTTPVENKRCREYLKMVRKRSSNVCYFCQLIFKGVPHIDHVVALARGGRHEIGNLCVSCPDCNFKKNARPASQLTAIHQILFDF
jgi:hypothetical protein